MELIFVKGKYITKEKTETDYHTEEYGEKYFMFKYEKTVFIPKKGSVIKKYSIPLDQFKEWEKYEKINNTTFPGTYFINKYNQPERLEQFKDVRFIGYEIKDSILVESIWLSDFEVELLLCN